MIYDFICDNCNLKTEVIKKVNEGKEEIKCICGAKMRRLYSPFSFKFDFKAGFDPGLGKYISCKKERENMIAEKGLRRIRD